MERPVTLDESRAEVLRLRARIVAPEKMAFAALELALRIRPEELTTNLELARGRLSVDYAISSFAPDLKDPGERVFVAEEVERLMGGVQADLGLTGGISIAENG